VSEIALATEHIRAMLGPEWSMQLDCGPEVRLVQRLRGPCLLESMGCGDPSPIIYRGEPVTPADLRPPPHVDGASGIAFVSAEPGILDRVVDEAIRRAHYRVRGLGLLREAIREALHDARPLGLTRDEIVATVGGGPKEVQSMLMAMADDLAHDGSERRPWRDVGVRWRCTCCRCIAERNAWRARAAGDVEHAK
jgi:hypothetical protein